ncbi:8859_t:CDS:1 [Funneliformis geosporum]|uniref:14090_t:CDS:1 n=1 Tax=Funneliformis geosporum TaxID=1117311 RepID=A0A9W4SLZ0_9GLOM|nr:14090_t:CDS:1 [Funneliformis geosporum]CAI2176808.1 8859_t:CDS:1 [Funneliformis geosporum]
MSATINKVQHSQQLYRPKLKTSFSNPFPFKSVFHESPKCQSTTFHIPQEEDENSFSKPINKNNMSKSNTFSSFSSIFSNSRSNKFFNRRRSEVYGEKDEFTNGCFGSLSTLGSKIRYKLHNTWFLVKTKCKRRIHKKRSIKDEWSSKARTLNQL